jgi:putative ABC transport system permease protein
MIPLKYNVRNLKVRWVTTLLTMLGTGLVVWSSCILFGLVDGLQHSLKVSGDPLDLIVLRKGSTNETNGGFEATKAQELATLSGIARDESGMPLVASELLNIPVVARLDGSRTNVIVRGVDPASPKLRKDFTILPGGRYFQPGREECVVSRNIARRFKGAQLGAEFRVGEKEAYRVVGLFTAGGGAAESEVWVDRRDLERHTSFAGTVSSVQMRAAGPTELESLRKNIGENRQFRLLAWKESEFFQKQSLSSMFLKVFGTIIAVLLTLGAMFAAANTMFAAVSSRTREIGTLRALGFSQFDVLISFLGESILLCTLGGVLGWLATIPMGAISFGTSDFDSFAEKTINFRFGLLVGLVALGMTACMGIFGGLFPAVRAVRLDVIKALREL